MQKQFFVIAAIISALFFAVPFVSAFGEVAGPIVFNVAPGSRQTQNWGVLNNGSINVTITADGAAAQYISFQNATLLPNDQITWIPVTATIPSGYTGSSNITGHLYALAQGQPGQVQINLQLEKAFYILIPSAPSNSLTSGQINNGVAGGQVNTGSTTSSSSATSSATSSSSATQTPTSATTIPTSSSTSAFPNLPTGLFALQPIYYVTAGILAVIIIAGIFFLLRNRHNEKSEDVNSNNDSADSNNEIVDSNNANL